MYKMQKIADHQIFNILLVITVIHKMMAVDQGYKLKRIWSSCEGEDTVILQHLGSHQGH